MFDYDFDQIVKTNGSKNCPNCGAPIENERCPQAELIAEANDIYDTFGSRLLTLMPHNYLSMEFGVLQ